MAEAVYKCSPKTRAAILVAEDVLTDEQISAELGITRRTLANWKKRKDFAADVGGHVGAIQAGMLRLTIAKKHKRLKTLDDLHTKALAVIEARAAAMAGAAPGADTGLLTHQYKQVGTGRGSATVSEYTVDVALMREIRSLQEQAAKELGQWVEKSEALITGEIRLVGVDAEAL